ncbi:MAG TPA: hypothetical protein VFS43_18075 [Polyangiaceae bacterium]|nr:hypothetical protein [Polyangiaceae bacterium]
MRTTALRPLGAALALLLAPAACASPTSGPPRGQAAPAAPAGAAEAAVAPGEGPPAAPPAPPAPRAAAPRVEVPAWLHDRAARPHTATSLVGGDASSIDVLFGQFEHPDEAIVRFDRASGCAAAVAGPWPTLTLVVRGRDGFAPARLPPDAIAAAANSDAFRRELEGIQRIYARRGKTGEAKLAFSLDGQRVLVEATDEKLLASSDGGAHFAYLEGKLVGMPIVDPAGRFALVRLCSAGPCIQPLKVSSHRAALVSFDDLPRVRPLSGPSMHDAVIDPGGAWVLTTRSDVHGRKTATKLCFDVFPAPPGGAPSSSSCVATGWAGEWHMLSASKGARFGVVALVGRPRHPAEDPSHGPVRLSVRSLPDGAEREAFDVDGDWENYQWIDVAVSDRGAVAYADPRTEGEAFGPILRPGPPPRPVVVRGGGLAPRTLGPGRPLGWLNERELVVLDPTKANDPQGCGLLRVVDVGAI